MRNRAIAAVFLGLTLAMSTGALAKQPKTYQVTGKVLEVTTDMIVVDKDGDRWEIGRTADTKVDGELKVGEKVTIQYRMSAASVDAKG